MKKYYGIIIFAMLVITCDSQPDKELVSENDRNLFQDLAIAETGLDFPPSQKHLETCRRIQDIPCLNSFRSFNEGKAKLLQIPRYDGLELTLKWLNESCTMEPPTDFEYICIGTLNALYFYSDETEDLRIRQFLSRLPQSTLENVFDRSASLGLCWLENRPDESAWRSWLESKQLDTKIKSHAIYRLDKPTPPSDPLHEFPYNQAFRP